MDQNSSLVTSYDFNSQAGITSVLAAVRQSGLNSADKNELRDLVFLYKSGGGDESVRISLEQKLKAHKIEVVLPKSVVTSSAPALSLPFGSYRPAPVFKSPKVEFTPVASKPVATPQMATEVATPKVAAEEVVVAEAAAPVEAPIAVSKPMPAFVPKPEPTPVFTPPVSIPPVEPVLPAEVVKSDDMDTPAVTPPSVSNNTNYLDRIREIKSVVNNKVGNPVNLVDINNEVGREYMNALLDSMKKLNGGLAGDLDKAMQRLEIAFLAVEKAIIEHAKTTQNADSASQQINSNLSPSSVIKKEAASNNVEIKSGFDDVKTDDVRTGFEVNGVSGAVNANAVSETKVDSAVYVPVTQPENSPTFSVPSTPAPAAVPSPFPRKVVSLAEEKKILTPADLPEYSVTAEDLANPLFTGEVDRGLDQLLSDWPLFKKSGLFGTGPKGREHPLYKKISGLQIPLLLAGRFEGASQEIKQSITDYMNGWRYEQGIIYEQGETFDTYLRRVIKHIIDLQKRRNPA